MHGFKKKAVDVHWRILKNASNVHSYCKIYVKSGWKNKMISAHEITVVSIVIRFSLAIIAGGIIGMEREKKNMPAGMRTYMLVTLGSCIAMLINQYIYQVYGTGDLARMAAQVVNGIGFLGAGTIIVTSHNQIKGLTTAAGLWASACVGLAIGIGFYEAAVIGVIAIFVVIKVLHEWDFRVKQNAPEVIAYIELDENKQFGDFIRSVHDKKLRVSNVQRDANMMESTGIVAFTLTLRGDVQLTQDDLMKEIRSIDGVSYVEVI